MSQKPNMNPFPYTLSGEIVRIRVPRPAPRCVRTKQSCRFMKSSRRKSYMSWISKPLTKVARKINRLQQRNMHWKHKHCTTRRFSQLEIGAVTRLATCCRHKLEPGETFYEAYCKGQVFSMSTADSSCFSWKLYWSVDYPRASSAASHRGCIRFC